MHWHILNDFIDYLVVAYFLGPPCSLMSETANGTLTSITLLTVV